MWTDVFGTRRCCGEVVPAGARRHGLLFAIELAFHEVINGVDR
jgi:hypothetical protein